MRRRTLTPIALLSLVALLLSGLLAFPRPAQAAFDTKMRYFGHLEAAGGGSITDVAVVEPYAYLAEGTGGLRVADVRERVEVPSYIAAYDPAQLRKLDAANGFLYGVDSTGDLHVYSLQQPRSPAQVGSLALDISSDIHVAGSYVYALNPAGLLIIDVSAPQAPKQVGSLAIPDALDLAVDGLTVFVTSCCTSTATFPNGPLRSIDVSKAASPVQLDMVNAGGRKLTVTDGVVYTIQGGCADVCTGTLATVDAHDPNNLVVIEQRGLTTVPSPLPSQVLAMAGQLFYTRDYCRFICNGLGIEAFNIDTTSLKPAYSDGIGYPRNFTQQADALVPYEPASNGLVFAGNRLYIPFGTQGMLIFEAGRYRTYLPALIGP